MCTNPTHPAVHYNPPESPPVEVQVQAESAWLLEARSRIRQGNWMELGPLCGSPTPCVRTDSWEQRGVKGPENRRTD